MPSDLVFTLPANRAVSVCHRPVLHASLFVLLLVAASFVSSGCGDDEASYDMEWLLGASSTFEATMEGIVEGSIAGTATFHMDSEGNLVGIELVHIDDSTRGISIELEPRPMEARAYDVVMPELMGFERSDSQAGFTAFFESGDHSFQAARGMLRIDQADRTSIQGTFEIEMEGRSSENGGVAEGDVTVHGTFQATRRHE